MGLETIKYQTMVLNFGLGDNRCHSRGNSTRYIRIRTLLVGNFAHKGLFRTEDHDNPYQAQTLLSFVAILTRTISSRGTDILMDAFVRLQDV